MNGEAVPGIKEGAYGVLRAGFFLVPATRVTKGLIVRKQYGAGGVKGGIGGSPLPCYVRQLHLIRGSSGVCYLWHVE